MRRAGRALLEDFGVRAPAPPPAPARPVEPAPAPPVEQLEPVQPTPDQPRLEPLPEGLVWIGRAPHRPELERFVHHLSAARAAPSR
jgi:hypothetical protein